MTIKAGLTPPQLTPGAWPYWLRMGQGLVIVITVIITACSLYVNNLVIHCPSVYFLSTYCVSSPTFLGLLK